MEKKSIKKFQQFTPTRTILFSFIGVVLLGTLLLSLPFSTKTNISILDNLFTATSATCVTGLVTINVVDSYTLFGQFVILILMQIGGLGFITLFLFFVTTISSKLSLKNKNLLSESLSLQSNFQMTSLLRHILGFTFLFEGIGAIILSLRFMKDYPFMKAIFMGIFTSVSAFCNAGFDIVGGNSLAPYVTDFTVNIVVMLLIILGGIGFTVWMEIGHVIKYCFIKKEITLAKARRQMKMHTKLVVSFTAILLLSGMFFTLLFEWNNPETIGNFSFFEKILCAMFTSTTLRTAGFSTVNFAGLRPSLQFIMLLYMLIGGSPGGTAGGIKTTTIAVLSLAAIAYLRGSAHIRLHRKELKVDTIRKVIAILSASMSLLFVAIVVLLATETQLTTMEIMFEVVSAFATVGLSLNVTSRLTTIGKIVIIILMYTGRVGVLTIGIGLMDKISHSSHAENEVTYPHEDILIG